MGGSLTAFLRAENRKTWGLFVVVLILLALQVYAFAWGTIANLVDWDYNLYALQICTLGALVSTLLPVWFGILRVRSWARLNHLAHRRLFAESDLLVLLLSPELPAAMDEALNFTRPPAMLRGGKTRREEAGLISTFRHFVRHFEAYVGAYEVGRGRPWASRAVRKGRPVWLIGGSVIFMCLALAVIKSWGLALFPILYIALVWNTCRLEAQRIGLRDALLEVFDPERTLPERLSGQEPETVELHSELRAAVKRRAAPSTRSLRV